MPREERGDFFVSDEFNCINKLRSILIYTK